MAPQPPGPSRALNALRAFRAGENECLGVLAAHPLVNAMDCGRDEADGWPIARDEAENWLYVTAMAANYPGQGAGREILQALCEACDHAQAVIVLDAKAYGQGLSQSQLVAFYERYGFKRDETLADYLDTPMVRHPYCIDTIAHRNSA